MDEPALIAGLRERDSAAVCVLIERYGDRLLRAAYLHCGNRTEAEDLVQETFLQAFRSAHRYRGSAALYTWMYAILLNLCRHYRRKRARWVEADGKSETDVARLDGGAVESDRIVAQDALDAAFARISAAHREVLILRFYDGRKIEEIAQLLRLSTGTVKSRLHYAIAEMQRLVPAELNLLIDGGTDPMDTAL